MSLSNVLLPEQVLRNYFQAKDENRPHVLDLTFEEDAILDVRSDTSAISFPAITRGRDGIADVLVRRFGQTYENVYTFAMSRPTGALREFTCGWLVAMTEKTTGAIRVGCGRYDWTFSKKQPHLASSLVITISSMAVLPASTMSQVFAWISRLPYPWTSRSEVLGFAPDLPEIRAVLAHLVED